MKRSKKSAPVPDPTYAPPAGMTALEDVAADAIAAEVMGAALADLMLGGVESKNDFAHMGSAVEVAAAIERAKPALENAGLAVSCAGTTVTAKPTAAFAPPPMPPGSW